MKHKCVENGGCKAANCDGGIVSKSQRKRLAIQGGLEKKAYDISYRLKESKLHLIQCLANDLELSEVLVQEYNELHTEYLDVTDKLLGRCS